MHRYEGAPAFYAGLGPALVEISHVGVEFPAYEYLRRKFTGGGIGDPGGNWFAVLCASIFSKMLASSVKYPHEVIRTRLQIQQRAMLGPEFLLGLGSVQRRSVARKICCRVDSKPLRGLCLQRTPRRRNDVARSPTPSERWGEHILPGAQPRRPRKH